MLAAAITVPLLAAIAYPLLARALLRLSVLSAEQQSQLCDVLPPQHRALSRQFFLWDTGRRVCNAAVLGCLPRYSLVLISDGIWDHLSPRHVAAVVAHEVGHLRLWHVPIRLSIVFAGGLLGLTLVQQAAHLAGSQWMWQSLVLLLTFAYVWLILHLVAPLLEFQADAYAVETLGQTSGNRRHSALVVVQALSQLTALSGLGPRQKAWLYPSFEQRRRAILGHQASAKLRRHLQNLIRLIWVGQLALIGLCLWLLITR